MDFGYQSQVAPRCDFLDLRIVAREEVRKGLLDVPASFNSDRCAACWPGRQSGRHVDETNSMMHTAYDSAHFFGGMILFFGLIGVAVYSVLIFIALVFSAFRSVNPLRTSFWFSAIVSLPFLVALIFMLPYLSQILDSGDDSIQVMLIVHAVLLVFVWAGPIVQYRRARRLRPRTRE